EEVSASHDLGTPGLQVKPRVRSVGIPKEIQECVPLWSGGLKFLCCSCPDFWGTVIAQTHQVRNGDVVEILTVGAFTSVLGSEPRFELSETAGINPEKQECLDIPQRLDLRVIRVCAGHRTLPRSPGERSSPRPYHGQQPPSQYPDQPVLS